MKKKINILIELTAFAIVLTTIMGCNLLSGSKSSDDTTNKSANNQTDGKPAEANKTPNQKLKAEKADFTVTAEELDKEFTRKGVTDTDLKKYAAKNIAVTGRVSLLSLEKQGTTQPWVTLYAPGVLHGVSCYFDDDNLEQMKKLKMDKNVKVQGFKDDFIVPETSPRLEHCIVLEAN